MPFPSWTKSTSTQDKQSCKKVKAKVYPSNV